MPCNVAHQDTPLPMPGKNKCTFRHAPLPASCCVYFAGLSAYTSTNSRDGIVKVPAFFCLTVVGFRRESLVRRRMETNSMSVILHSQNVDDFVTCKCAASVAVRFFESSDSETARDHSEPSKWLKSFRLDFNGSGRCALICAWASARNMTHYMTIRGPSPRAGICTSHRVTMRTDQLERIYSSVRKNHGMDARYTPLHARKAGVLPAVQFSLADSTNPN